MAKEKIEEHRKKLEAERRLITEELKTDAAPISFGTDQDHFDEKTDEAEELGNQLAAMQGLKERLSEIDIALAKIAEGEYGKCEACGKDIEEEVLNLDPESRYCKACKLARKKE